MCHGIHAKSRDSLRDLEWGSEGLTRRGLENAHVEAEVEPECKAMQENWGRGREVVVLQNGRCPTSSKTW